MNIEKIRLELSVKLNKRINNIDIAKHLGVCQNTITNWASGKTKPREKRKKEIEEKTGMIL